MPPTVTRTKRLRRAVREAEILKCAKLVFCERGYENTLISEIAERAGMVEGAIYYYFPSKRDLMIRVMDEWISTLVSEYEKNLEGVSGTENRLRMFLRSNLRTIKNEPEMAKLYYQTGHVLDPELGDSKFMEIGNRYGARLYQTVEDAIASGEFRGDIPSNVAISLIAGAIQVNSLALLRGTATASPDELADTISKVLYQGLAAGPRSEGDPLLTSIQKIESALTGLKTMATARPQPGKPPR
jgi:AcrR family transcriptional regulator